MKNFADFLRKIGAVSGPQNQTIEKIDKLIEKISIRLETQPWDLRKKLDGIETQVRSLSKRVRIIEEKQATYLREKGLIARQEESLAELLSFESIPFVIKGLTEERSLTLKREKEKEQ